MFAHRVFFFRNTPVYRRLGYMLETFTSMSALTAMEIIGPILLLAALIYGVNRRRLTSRERTRQDEATRRLHG